MLRAITIAATALCASICAVPSVAQTIAADHEWIVPPRQPGDMIVVTAKMPINLPKIDIETVNGEAKVSLSGERVGALNNLNILAGSLRVVRLPWPKELPQGEVTVKLQTGYASVS